MYLGFSKHSIMSSINSNGLVLPSQFAFLLFIFLVLLLWLEHPMLCWIKVARIGIFVLFLILEEMLSVFHCWKTGFDKLRALGLSYVTLIMLSYVLFMPYFWRVFIINRYWLLSETFSATRDDHMVFILQFVTVVYHIICGYWNTFASLG